MTMTNPLPFIDLKTQQKKIHDRIMENIRRVLAHGQYILGPEVRELEERLAAYVGVRHAITCSSGTDSLLMVLMAKGVGPGDAIFTTPFTFIATAEVVQLLGATPVFVDIDPKTYNINPEALRDALVNFDKKAPAAGIKPRGIIAVDLFGQPADYDRINSLARDYNLFVLEDAAQSFGAAYHRRRAGALAEAAATSFFPAKPLGCYGDGGSVFTDNDELAGILISIRNHGQGADRYDNVRLGINGRLDTLQAAVLLAKLEIFDEEVASRQEIARRYHEGLKDIVAVPEVAPGCISAWAQYSVEAKARGPIQARLQEAGVPTAIYYPKPLHLQEVFRGLGYGPGDFPASEAAAARIFSLPMHPYLSKSDQERIIGVIREAAA
jgi:UDP-2-acetamido-2-deoxy-ribo-hexuluronate aminotransferase